MNYTVGDFLIRIKNGARAKTKQITAEKTRLNVAVAEALKRAGFVAKVDTDKTSITVTLVYKKKQPRLMDLRLVSKPGLRIYKNVEELESRRAASMYFLSTPKGILSSREAVKERVGGEIIVEIW